jgi:glycine cleavage system H protein
MLGELVEANFKVAVGDPIFPGDSIGSVEGFKAASDVLCVMEGSFAGMNDALNVDACIVKSDPYEVGWLYAAKGQPEEDSLDVHGYVALLQETIQRMADAGYGHDEEGAKEDE